VVGTAEIYPSLGLSSHQAVLPNPTKDGGGGVARPEDDQKYLVIDPLPSSHTFADNVHVKAGLVGD